MRAGDGPASRGSADARADVDPDDVPADGEDLFRLAVDRAAVGMCLVSPDGQFLRVNDSLCALLGRDADELRSSTWQELTHPDDLDADLALVDDLLAGRRDQYRFLKRFIRADETVVWGDLSVSCVRSADGSVRWFISQITDVTEREEALHAFAESQELFGILMDHSAVGMSLTSPDGRLLRVNESLCRLFGRTEEELIAASWEDLTEPGVVEGERELLGDLLADRRNSYRLLKRFARPDGSLVWGDLSISCVRRADRSVGYFVAQIIDVTERELAQVELTGVLDSMLDPLVLVEPVRQDGEVVDVRFRLANSATGRYLGVPAQALVGRTLIQAYPGAAVDAILDMVRRALESDTPLELDAVRMPSVFSPDERWFDIRVASVGDAVSITWRDRTDQHLAAEALALEQAQYRLLADNSMDVVIRSGANGLVEWVSPSIAEALGWMPGEVIGRRLSEYLHPDDLQQLVQRKRAVIEGGSTEGRATARVATEDGQWRWMSVHGRALVGEGGVIAGGIDALRDIQTEHDAAVELEKRERMLRGVIGSLIDPWVLLSAVRDDSGRIVDFEYVDVNDAAIAANRTSREELVGERLMGLFPEHAPSGLLERYAQVVETGTALAMDDDPFTSPFDGVTRYFDNRAVRVGDGISLTWRDVSDRFEARQVLGRQADQDLLTGVGNRRQLGRRLEEIFARVPRSGTQIAVLYCDVDHFKDVNDDFGHAAGDEVLASVARQIRGALREDDVVARLGGDEFVVVLDGVRDAPDAAHVAEKIAEAVRRPVQVADAAVTPQLSIGVAVTEYGSDAQEAMTRADAALYEAKRSGRNRVVISPPGAIRADA